MEKVRILCYGDSNTWGYISGSDHKRYGIKLHKVQFSWESRRPFTSSHHDQEQFCAHTPLKHLNSSARMNYQFATLSKAYSSTQLMILNPR